MMKNWMPPEKLYEEIVKTDSGVIGFDCGEVTTGLCVGKVCNMRYAYPVMALKNLGQKYYLSDLEKYFNSLSNGEDGVILDGKWFLPDDIYSPQVLNMNTMGVSVVQEIVNALAVNHGVQYYVFGFNAHESYWDDESKYTFVENQIKRLEQDGNLAHKCFTIVDESHSTKETDNFLSTQFPELSDAYEILNKYPDVQLKYIKSRKFDLQSFQYDLAQFRKRLLDSYSAAHFTRIFLDKGYKGLLLGGGDRAKAKDERMMKFAHDLGYDVSRGRDPTRIFK